jgi:hypothetical protein
MHRPSKVLLIALTLLTKPRPARSLDETAPSVPDPSFVLAKRALTPLAPIGCVMAMIAVDGHPI